MLKASVPQTMIEQCCLTHKQIAFKGTAAPSSWLSSEFKVANSQFESSTKGCGENQQVFDDLRSQRVGKCIEDVSGVLYEPHDRKQVARKMLQVLASLKARKSDFHPECLEPQKSFEARPEMSECEAEESYPASIDSRYGSEVKFSCGNCGGNNKNALSAILNDQESHVSANAKPMEQRV